MPPIKRQKRFMDRDPRPWVPSRKHSHAHKDTNEEFDRLYRYVTSLDTRIRASVSDDGTIINSTGAPLAPGSLLGWTSAGVLALADAGDGTAAGAKIRPLMVSPPSTVGVNERFTPHGTGELAYVATDGTGTFTKGKRLVCKTTPGIATLTAPASPDKIFSVGWVSDDLDTTTNLVLARLELGFGATS